MVALLSHLNPTPAFPAYTGPYQVGTVDVEIPVGDITNNTSKSNSAIPTVAFRVFYPCSPPQHSPRPVRWIQSPQRSIVSAYARFLGAGSTFSNAFSYLSALLYYTTIPASRDAPLLKPQNGSSEWPVTVFSHGLGGTRNSYSHFCGSLAAHGVVVIAPEHRDGSGPISHIRATSTTEASTVDYRRVSHSPNKQTYDARDDQLRIRLWELGLIHEALEKMNSGEGLQNLAIHKGSASKFANDANTLKMFHNSLAVAEPGSISFAGHSFGAATAIQFVKSVYYSSRGVDASPIFDKTTLTPSIRAQITPSTPLILLDPWGLPLNSPSTRALNTQPLPCFSTKTSTTPGGANTLAILSEAFFKWRGNLSEIQRALRDPHASHNQHRRPQAHIFYPVKSAHLSQSDFGLLFPNITKYVAKADEPVRTMTLNVRAALQVLRGAGVKVAETSRRDREVSGDDDDDKGGDWRILSGDEGAVRGWVALSADEGVANGRRAQQQQQQQKQDQGGEKEMQEAMGAAAGQGELKGAVTA